MRWTKRATSALCAAALLAGCSGIPPRLDPQLAPAAIGDQTADGLPCAPLEGHRLYRVADDALGLAEQTLGEAGLALASPTLAAALVPGALSVPLTIDASGDGGDGEADRRQTLADDPALTTPALKAAARTERRLAADTWFAKSALQPYLVRTVMAEDRAGSFRACWAGTVLHVNFVSAGISALPFAERPMVILLSEPPSRVMADIVDRVPGTAGERAFQVFFDFARSDLTAAGRKVIEAAADTAKSGHPIHILVTGHTDTVGTAGFNQTLSDQRATTVARELVADGMPAGGIATRGVGKSDLLVPTPDGTREAQNRRATIELDPKPPAG
jgi:outer membrane protein OmpA-like peptidoglycan-associated protein